MKTLSVLAMSLALVCSTVSAHGWEHRGGFRGEDHDGGGLAAGILFGALVGSAMTPRYERSYQEPYQPQYQYQPEVIYTQRVPVYCEDGYGYRYVCQWRYIERPQYRDYDDER